MNDSLFLSKVPIELFAFCSYVPMSSDDNYYCKTEQEAVQHCKFLGVKRMNKPQNKNLLLHRFAIFNTRSRIFKDQVNRQAQTKRHSLRINARLHSASRYASIIKRKDSFDAETLISSREKNITVLRRKITEKVY